VTEAGDKPDTNSARYQTPDGQKVHGLIDEAPSGVVFRVDEQGRALWEIPYASIERIKTSFLRPRVMKIAARGDEYRLVLTGAVIDGSHHGTMTWSGTAPGESSMTREESTANDIAAFIPAVVRVVDYVAADRVRRRRVCNRILARR